MQKVLLFSFLLMIGLVGSQVLPALAGRHAASMAEAISVLTLIALAFIMIHVGYEFEIDKRNTGQYAWDSVVALTAAALPWLFVTLYFVFVMLPAETWGQSAAWKETLLSGLFAAPTSAGVLFSMLAAAGLSATWMFKKARVLAVFDDLDTVLLMIPLKMMIVGPAWQLAVVVVFMVVLLWLAWRYLHQWAIPVAWPWVIAYSTGIVAVTEAVYLASKTIDAHVPIHIEVLLPAFVLGCLLRRPTGADPHGDDARPGHQEGPESAGEQRVATIISAVFMVLVGLSMPALFAAPSAKAGALLSTTVTGAQPPLGMAAILWHVLAVTILANLGKMFPALAYRREAHWRERLAVAIGMWPRGEVGAGILVISLGYGLGGPIVTVAILSLALNLLLTGFFIWIVQRLLSDAPAVRR